MYAQSLGAAASYAGQTMTTTATPPKPTRFASCAGQLEARVAHLGGLFDRLYRVADRLGGSAPEPVGDNPENKLRGNGSCIASQMEISIDLFDEVIRRAERTTERLEQL